MPGGRRLEPRVAQTRRHYFQRRQLSFQGASPHAEEPNPADVERPGDAPSLQIQEAFRRVKNVNRNLLFAEIATGNCVPAALPPKFSIDTTNVCNFRCRRCHQGLRQEFHHTHLDLRSVDKIAQGMPVAEDMTLGGTGEPLLSPAVPALCALAQRHQVRSEIITNGVALNNPKIPRGSGGVWSVSFDGAVKRTFEAIRVGSPFETIVQRIGDFCQRNPQLRVILNMVVCRANLDEIYGVAEWAVKFRANVNLNKLFAYMEHLEPLALRKSDAAALQEQIRRATQLCAQHGLRLAHSVYLDDAPDGSEPLNKEKLLAALEAMPVTQGVPIGDLKASCAMLENHSYDYLPRPLMEAVASAVRSVRVPEPAIPAPITGRGGALDIGRMTRRYKQLGRRIRRLPAEEIRVPYCLSPWTRLYVEASSFLRPCCVWPGHFVDLKDFEYAAGRAFCGGVQGSAAEDAGGRGTAEALPELHFAERYFGLPQFLQFLIDHGVDVLRLRLPPNFSPPDEAKVMLSPESRQQALEILDWGPQSVERGAKIQSSAVRFITLVGAMQRPHHQQNVRRLGAPARENGSRCGRANALCMGSGRVLRSSGAVPHSRDRSDLSAPVGRGSVFGKRPRRGPTSCSDGCGDRKMPPIGDAEKERPSMRSSPQNVGLTKRLVTISLWPPRSL